MKFRTLGRPMRTGICALLLLLATGALAVARLGRPAPPRTEQATFAAGCFWGVEAAFRRTPGVVATAAGYSGGHVVSPTYAQLGTGSTGHAEAVRVTYDPARVSYAELLDVFWSCHDPTIDHDGGPHRSIVFTRTEEQAAIARASLEELTKGGVFARPILTDIRPAAPFYEAEAEHQHYHEQHGRGGVCHTGKVVVHTRLAARAAGERACGNPKPESPTSE